jgi:poly(3-hydroxybutyrate) depolymerase
MRDAGEPAIIAGLTKRLRDQYAIPEDRVFVAGLSAGGAMAAVMGETYPDLYRAIGVHSGLAFGAAEGSISALAAMRGQANGDPVPSWHPTGELEPRPRIIVFHGSADKTVHPLNADRIVAGKIGAEPRIFRSEFTAGESRGHTRLVVESENGMHDLECWIINGVSTLGPVEMKAAPILTRRTQTRPRPWCTSSLMAPPSHPACENTFIWELLSPSRNVAL